MTTTQVPTTAATPPNPVATDVTPADQPDPDTGLLDLRTFVILLCSLVTALITGTGSGLTAAYNIEQCPVVAGVIAGLAVGITTLLGTAATMNALISRGP